MLEEEHEKTVEHNDRARLIRVYLYYRLVLAALLLIVYSLRLNDQLIGSSNGPLFLTTSAFYTFIAFVSLFVFKKEQLAYSIKLLAVVIVIDVFALLAMVHASGGVQNSLSYLLLVTVAMASTYFTRRFLLGLAATITILLLGEAIYVGLNAGNISAQLFSAGVQGILVFITTLVFHYVTERAAHSDKQAALQTVYAEQLQKLAQNIVTRMRTGVVVVSHNGQVGLINESALQLLDLSSNQDYTGLPVERFTELADILKKYDEEKVQTKPFSYTCKNGQELRVSRAVLDQNLASTANGTTETHSVFYLEDNRALQQQAQQLKLASLGRLTASIAHEIRNPLGAISHAAQLLSEAQDIAKSDERLLQILLQHCKRVNQIVDNTLAISRQKQTEQEEIDLIHWIPNFIHEYQNGQKSDIELRTLSNHARVRVDNNQLKQILTNLLDNGIRHSVKEINEPKLIVEVGLNDNIKTAYLEVIDYGEGIPEENIQTIFEPFFTTEKQGSGLGLYICRELSEINQINIFYYRNRKNQSCFRLNFSYYKKMA